MRIHHVGCLVENIEESSSFYRALPGFHNASEVFNISDQKVKVCFIDIGNNVSIELVEPHIDNIPLQKMKTKKMPYYHIGYMVEDINLKAEELCNHGCVILNSFKSEAFNNNQCMFLYTPDMHLIELIES